MISIVDYGMGNIQSVANAFGHIGHEAVPISAPAEIASADRLVLPGVGSFFQASERLDASMRDALSEAVEAKQRPILGICLGMQLLASRGTEHGDSDGLGWIPGTVEMIPRGPENLRLPHIGWNVLRDIDSDCLLLDIEDEGTDCYFVHSYFLNAENPDDVVAVTDYGGPVTAAVARNNVFGVQFHPEKSLPLGLEILDRFARL
jgi:glutamine amidotransferase